MRFKRTQSLRHGEIAGSLRQRPALLPVLLSLAFGAGVLPQQALAQSAETAQAAGDPLRKAAPLASAEATLAAVQVTASGAPSGELPRPYAGGQVARGGSLGLLGTADAMDVPFSTTNYTTELLENQQARSLADVVVNDASVRVLTASGGFGEDFQIRGFTVPSGDVGLNGLYGLVSGSRVPAELIERVEVLKGPGALINGIAPNGSIGGGINVVTKRAADDPLTRLTTTFMSDSQLGAHIDVGRRFGDDKAWGVRVNGVMRDGEASIDDGNQNVGLASLAVDYRGSRLRWSLDTFTQREDIDETRPQIGFAAGLKSIPTPPSSSANFYPGADLKLRDTTTASRLEYDINDALTAYADIGYRDGSAEQVFPVTTGGANALGNFTVRSTYYDSYSKTTSADTGLRARFSTAGVGHTLTLGLSKLSQEAGNAYVQGATTVASNIYQPVALPAISAARTAPRKASETTLSSVAIADTLSFANDRLLLTLGLRDQTVEMENFSTTTGQSTSRYKASAVAPLAGIVFKPQANVALYGNYTDGLTRGQIVGATYANAGEVLAPYKSEQYEAGVKIDWGKVTTGASVFQIARPNGQVDSRTNIYSYDGEQRNRGLELSAYGELQHGLRIMTSAVFNDATLTSTAGGVNQGKDAPGVPQRTFNLGVDWDTPWLPALSVNGRAIYTSSMFFDSANTLRIDGWTRYDVGARYHTRVASKPVVLRANIENLFDENYWLVSGTYATVSAPRTLVLSASIDF